MVKGTNEQEQIKYELYNKIKKHELEIVACKQKINNMNLVIIQTCTSKYGEHIFELEQENSLYGESYFICKNCGYER